MTRDEKVIDAEGLTRHFKVYRKRAGFWAAVRGLFRRDYHVVRAVDGVSFQVHAGEIVGFLGPNGAGKTTTLKMLSGLLYPTAGRATVLGFVPWERHNAFRRQFALVMGQRNQLWWDLPAIESFHLQREIYEIPRGDFERRLSELTEALQVGDLLRQPVRELSLGERMKMELIGAFLHAPRLVLLDEPTLGLDVVAQAAILDCLRRFNRRYGTTILLTSHYMRDVEELCERIIVINSGRIVYDGGLQGVVERFGRHKVVRLQFHTASGTPGPETWNGSIELLEHRPPLVKLRVEREQVSQLLHRLLARWQLDDISVEDPPLEEIISDVFHTTASPSSPEPTPQR